MGDCPFCHRVLLTLANKVCHHTASFGIICGHLDLNPGLNSLFGAINFYQGIPFNTELIDLSAPRPQWLLDVSGGKVRTHAEC